MLTWKHRSYFQTSWAIFWIGCKKGCLYMRSSVLFWNWQLSQRATVLGWCFEGFFSMPAFRNSLWGLVSHCQLEFLSGWLLPTGSGVLAPWPSAPAAWLGMIQMIAPLLPIFWPPPSFSLFCLGQGCLHLAL